MVDQFDRSRAHAQMTVYRNRDGYTRDNVSVGTDAMVTVYDKSRTRPDLQGVDIGFTIVRRDEVLGRLPVGGNPSFEAAVYPALVEQGRLGAYQTDHRYYSVGSLDRLPATERFLAFEPAVVLDRDGVLNVCPPKAEYVTSWTEFRWLPGARQALRMLKEQGIRVFIMTNQPGIARGRMTAEDLSSIHSRMCDEARQAGGEITGIYYCPHGWDEGCECRKPAPGMLFKIQREHQLDLSRTVVYGDDGRDEQAAVAAGAPFRLVTPERGLFDLLTRAEARRGNAGHC
jgi:histidinol-phosphate phosphatase family protein